MKHGSDKKMIISMLTFAFLFLDKEMRSFKEADVKSPPPLGFIAVVDIQLIVLVNSKLV